MPANSITPVTSITPATTVTARRFQQSLLQIARELTALDGRLGALADSIQPEIGRALPGELRGTTHCVRADLLRDAIDTLESLGHATEESVLEKRHAVSSAIERIAAFG